MPCCTIPIIFGQQFLLRIDAKTSLSASKNIRFDQTTLAIDAAVARQGIALAHRSFVTSDLATGRLVEVFQTEMQTEKGYYVVAPRSSRHPELVASVRRWLFEQARTAA